MSTLIIKGTGSSFKVTAKAGSKTSNVFVATRAGVKRVNTQDRTNIKFAA